MPPSSITAPLVNAGDGPGQSAARARRVRRESRPEKQGSTRGSMQGSIPSQQMVYDDESEGDGEEEELEVRNCGIV
jgi:hypothetical protein